MDISVEEFLEKLKNTFESCYDLEYTIPDYDDLKEELDYLIEHYNDEDDV